MPLSWLEKPVFTTLLAVIGLASGCTGLYPTTPVCLAGARMTVDGECRSQRAPLHHIPFRDGVETKVMQGYHGYLSHKEDLAYSIDFRCEKGTPVVASRRGVVWGVREDSNKGCDDPSCVDDANYVILDHGDGTYSEYYHLRQLGAVVEEGEQVCAGQVIGLCGNTGYSSGPHLHFATTDTTRHTVPTRFVEGSGPGFVVPETAYTSRNRLRAGCAPTSYSSFSPDAFAHHGIYLRAPIPAVVTDRPDKTHIKGRYLGDHTMVAIHRKPIDGGEWVDTCVPTDDDGDFATTIAWPKDTFAAGTYWFMITGADKDCLSPGWSWSYKVKVR